MCISRELFADAMHTSWTSGTPAPSLLFVQSALMSVVGVWPLPRVSGIGAYHGMADETTLCSRSVHEKESRVLCGGFMGSH